MLHRVCKSAEALKMVAQFVIDCNLTKVEDWWQWTLLHHAAHVGDLESLRALIAALKGNFASMQQLARTRQEVRP